MHAVHAFCLFYILLPSLEVIQQAQSLQSSVLHNHIHFINNIPALMSQFVVKSDKFDIKFSEEVV